MSKIEIVKDDRGVKTARLGLVMVQNGLPAELVGAFRCGFQREGLHTDCFSVHQTMDPSPYDLRGGYERWPNETVEKKISLVNLGRAFGGYLEFFATLKFRHYEDIGGFLELCAIKHRAEEFCDMGIEYVMAAHQDSLWRSSGGFLNVPGLDCRPNWRSLEVGDVDSEIKAVEWFIVID